MNITNITNTCGPLTTNSINANGNQGNKIFFDNSVINKINQENTILSINKNNLDLINLNNESTTVISNTNDSNKNNQNVIPFMNEEKDTLIGKIINFYIFL
jgi:hypothetical protein